MSTEMNPCWKDIQKAAADAGIPYYMHEGIARYLCDHIPPGGFLRCIFENDLVHAAMRADDENIHKLPNYAQFLYWSVPMTAWGSPERVEAWLALREEEA